MSFEPGSDDSSPSKVKMQIRNRNGEVAIFGVIAVMVGILIGVVVTNVVAADGGSNRNLVDNVQDGPRNGIVTGVYEDEICFTMMSYRVGGRNDDHTSCAPNNMVKNLGMEYREGAVFAPRIDPVEGVILSVTAFEVVGSNSGLLLHLPVQQKEALPTPTTEATATVPAPSLPNSGSDGS